MEKLNCSHPNFESEIRVFRLTKEEGSEVYDYTADVKIRCSLCKTPMRFKGLPGGVNPSSPTINFDGTEARMPIEPSAEIKIN